MMFNDLRPALPFVVMVDGTIVYIKPFAGYYTWLEWFDLAPLDQSEAVLIAQLTADAAVAAASAAGDIAIEALGDAATAIVDAANAQAAADTAQATADDALAAAGAAGASPTFGVMMDEAVWNVTPTRAVNSLYPYNYGVFHLTPAAATKKINAQAGTWNIHIMTYKGPGAGQLTVEIDGTAILTNLELYQSTPAFTLYHHNLTGVTISTSGWHDLMISCSSKHASATNYGLLVFKIWGERTGA